MKDIKGKEIKVGQRIRIRYMYYIGHGNIEEIEEEYILENIEDLTMEGILSVEVIES